MKHFTYSTNNLTEFSNQVREIFIEQMEKEKVIDKDQAENMKNYSVIIAEKSLLWRFFDKLFFDKTEDPAIIITKVIK